MLKHSPALPVVLLKNKLFLLFLFLLVPLYKPFPSFAATDCVGGELSAQPPPSIDFLRSYRASFAAPTRIAVDSTDRIYISDPSRKEVMIRAADGRIVSRLLQEGSPLSVAVDPSGRIYVGDGDSGSVNVFDPGGHYLFSLGQGPGEFLIPSDIAIAQVSGRIYVTDSKAHQVKSYDADGLFHSSFGEPGSDDGQFKFPMGIFVDSANDEVLVVDQLNFRIQIFDLDGNYLSCIGKPPRGFFTSIRQFSVPQGLWVDNSGNIYVADAFEGRLQVLDRNGDIMGFIGEFGEGPGQLRVSMDMAMDSHGRLFVTAANNARIEIFGIGDYSDPERFIPASVEIHPNPIERPADDNRIVAYVEVPGYSLDAVILDSVLGNQSAMPVAIAKGDVDNDGIPDLRVEFDDNLAATLPPTGPATISVTGTLGSLIFEGIGNILIVSPAPLDSDGDSVIDAIDQCPLSQAEASVDSDGCSIAQHCPCAGPVPGETWKNQGAYRSCVAHIAQDFVKLGLISAKDKGLIMAEAAASRCGR